MNPLTNVKNIQKLSEQELKRSFKTSWHDQYKDSAWVFVGGLPYDLTEGDIICVFSQYGEVVNLNLVRDKSTGKSKGFCFLCYEDQRSTILAVDNFNGMKILGRIIRVDHVNDYKPPKESKNVDEVTKMLYEAGCAPGAKVLSVAEENRKQETTDSKEGILKKMKKEKKKKTKKLKKPTKSKSGRKKKKKRKEKSSSSSSSSSSISSESSSESSESPSSGEESEGEEPDQGRDARKEREKKTGGSAHGETKERNTSPGEHVRVKVEEEEEERKRARREERGIRECRGGPPPGQERGVRNERPEGRNARSGMGSKCDEGHPRWSADGEPRGSREGERWRGDADVRRREGERGRNEERRKRDGGGGGPSRDEGRCGNDDVGRRQWHDERDSVSWRRDGEAAGGDGRGRKDEYGRKQDDKDSRRKGEKYERVEDSYDRRKRDEKKRQDGRSHSPYDRDGGKTKRSR